MLCVCGPWRLFAGESLKRRVSRKDASSIKTQRTTEASLFDSSPFATIFAHFATKRHSSRLKRGRLLTQSAPALSLAPSGEGWFLPVLRQEKGVAIVEFPSSRVHAQARDDLGFPFLALAGDRHFFRRHDSGRVAA